MQLRFFTIPALVPGPAAEEVSAFLSAHRIIEITREFVANGPNSYWAICIAYTRGGASSIDAAPKRPPKDYRRCASRAGVPNAHRRPPLVGGDAA